jgi:hypothetical protein
LLAVLFLGSVAHVNATPINHRQNHIEKWGKFKEKEFKSKSSFMENRDGNNNNGLHAPEPSTILLLGLRLIGLAGWGRKRIKKK